MTDRDVLIARKHQIRRELERVQRELEALRARSAPPGRAIARLEAQVERMMAEEFNLRLAIDRARY